MRSCGEGALRSEVAGDQGQAEISGGTSFSTECLQSSWMSVGGSVGLVVGKGYHS